MALRNDRRSPVLRRPRRCRLAGAATPPKCTPRATNPTFFARDGPVFSRPWPPASNHHTLQAKRPGACCPVKSHATFPLWRKRAAIAVQAQASSKSSATQVRIASKASRSDTEPTALMSCGSYLNLDSTKRGARPQIMPEI